MEKQKNELNFFSTIKFLMQFMRGMKLNYFLFYIGWLFHTIVTVITPIIFGIMINQIVYYNNLTIFIQVGLVFLYVTIFGVILYYLIYEMYAYLWNGINRRLRTGMFKQLQKLDALEMAKLNHGETVSMIEFWSMEGVNFMVRNVVHNLNNITKIVVCISVIFLINKWFGLVAVVLVPVSVYVSFKIGKKIRSNSNKNREAYGSYLGWLFEIIHGFSDIRMLSAEKSIYNKFDKKQTELNDLKETIEKDNVWASELLLNIKNVILIVQYGLLAYLAIYNDLSIGSVTVMLTFFGLLSNSLEETARNYMDAQQRISIIQHIKYLFDKDTINYKIEEKEILQEKIENISIEKCSFGFEETNVLEDVDLLINRGEKIAIVGHSGSGKSTLLNLLLSMYQPKQGRILINGKDLKDYDIESLYRHISVVFQQVVLFEGTIRENLQMSEQISEEKLIEACKAAAIYDEILSLEDKFETQVELGGKNFSGGQKQRIGLARAYLKNSDVVIMDEATSAIDSNNEKMILDCWDEVLQDRICIVVSHRLSTVMKCDYVVMMKEGKICAKGTPDDLVKNNKEFIELFGVTEKEAI